MSYYNRHHRNYLEREDWEHDQELDTREYEQCGYDAECEAKDMKENPEQFEEKKEMNELGALEKVTAQPIVIEPPNRMSLEEAKNRIDDIEKFCKEILIPDIDFGVIPGTGTKKVLLKPGAEKICQFLMLRPVFVPVTIIEDFDKPFFFYRYECQLYHISTNRLVCSGIGSCSSNESKYRWRQTKKKCPDCEQESIIVNNFAEGNLNEYWYCYPKKNGCGGKYAKNHTTIAGQKTGKILNEDVADQANTIDKMAQKRSLLAPTLIVSGLSGRFTQDIDPERKTDPPTKPTQKSPPEKKQASPKAQTSKPLPRNGPTDIEQKLFTEARIKAEWICELLVREGIFRTDELALMEIMDNPDVTFDHLKNITKLSQHKKVLKAIEKGEKLLPSKESPTENKKSNNPI